MSQEIENQYKSVAMNVFAIVLNRLPLRHAYEYLSPDLVLEMDNFQFKGIDNWLAWVRYLHKTNAMTNISMKIKTIRLTGNTLYIEGYLEDKSKVICERSNRCLLEFHFIGNKVCKIVSSRKNYIFFYGLKITKPFYFFYLLMRVMLIKLQCKTF